MSVTSIDGKAALEQAKKEFRQERLDKAVAKLKTKLKEQDAAQTVLDNINREIADLEKAIEQGNF